jgi:hypothetical protein
LKFSIYIYIYKDLCSYVSKFHLYLFQTCDYKYNYKKSKNMSILNIVLNNIKACLQLYFIYALTNISNLIYYVSTLKFYRSHSSNPFHGKGITTWIYIVSNVINLGGFQCRSSRIYAFQTIQMNNCHFQTP